MIINTNVPALNTHRQMGINQNAMQTSMEKLSSGLRINRAGDDAAGLAISEKMRAQINGLDQASRNAQDGISLIQTAEGALDETHSILQRMRELATQAANDTNVAVDRNEIQKEINELTSEINRIGNTTEFNTQKLLQGDGGVSIEGTGLSGIENLSEGKTTNINATASITAAAITDAAGAAAVDGQSIKLQVQGQELTINFSHDTNLDAGKTELKDGTGNSITLALNADGTTGITADDMATAISNAFESMINENEALKGNFTVGTDVNYQNDDGTPAAAGAGAAVVTVMAKNDGANAGANGNIKTAVVSNAAVGAAVASATNANREVGTTAHVQATATIDFDGVKASDLVGQGMTIGGQVVEFYDANDGAYKGEAIGINVGSDDGTDLTGAALVTAIAPQLDNLEGVNVTADTTNLKIEATALGEAGNGLQVADGGVKTDFTAKFQIGANQGQSMQINIGDMRASALGISGASSDKAIDVENAKFTATTSVSNGTDNNKVEYALDVNSHESAAAAVTVINDAIEKVSSQRSNLGAFQNRLEHTISNLDNSSENLSAAESRIRDVDMAAEMMEMMRANILSQASQSMLAQANQQPQSVLQLLG